MSWDVVLLKEKFDLEDCQGYVPPSLGSRDEVIALLTELFPKFNANDKSWGVLLEDDFSIEFNIGRKETVDSIMLHIRGGGDPVAIVKGIMKALNWQALDVQTTEFIDIDTESDSWGKFQQFRDTVLQNYNKKEK